MGFPKAVTSVAVKRVGGAAFRVGFAEMSGWRPSMEDAHVIHFRDTWGCFGIFDGHGGDQCSRFISRRFSEELTKNGMPESDEAVTELALRLDKEFLDSNEPSGSTGTFVMLQAPSAPGGKYQLRVGNIGDSRVLLGRADGSIFPSAGVVRSAESMSLVSKGGRQEMGVPRVNGLAVSRAFGATLSVRRWEEQPVSCAPELQAFTASHTDFLIVVCDGISEGNFPSKAVVGHWQCHSTCRMRQQPYFDG
ncbi:unnamed protein product, partial [Symbiodinium sp. CCMP2456]